MRLQFLLLPHRRSPEDLAATKQIAQSLGISPTGEGRATLSAEIDSDKFESLFGTPQSEQTEALTNQPELPIPEPLREYVQSISLAPHHIYLNGPKQKTG